MFCSYENIKSTSIETCGMDVIKIEGKLPEVKMEYFSKKCCITNAIEGLKENIRKHSVIV